ncbi:NADH:flavin oxidoreductase/NADH oxidase [Basidiobolus meristosporus CBS 931.73]|uniref:NADH:flavin oxidoreductase/NADH oxidase n=1 Tax=Basidiobolus meristosporus CBS 931.73 TaxID=1314790 RepID=A0A1Y1Y3K9_9FUNG|nr:NADH:flavin oxidoreductase/NADH oxidase [Basidiobolus meristosporus CBS 931.73]|eukprot:ORX92622.1 NADH:flavin oxidoreductase/NADH oxidase [Basidiobolus meristosporus CBS 931.73]
MSASALKETNFIQPQVPQAGTPLETGEKKLPKLFQPLTVKNLELNNRLVVSPMCMYSSDDGFMTDFHLMHLGSFATRGASLVFCEATAVLPNGRITPYCAGLWKDEHIPQMKRIVDFIHSQGSKAGIQLAHAGRKASTMPPFLAGSSLSRESATESDGGWADVWGPSAIEWDKGWIRPREMSIEDIQRTLDAFSEAARRANEAGFDVIEIHGAHGYLIHSFLSSISNRRTDRYGGSLDNRMRFALEVTETVRKAWPAEKPLFFRLSCSDWVQDGWDIIQSVELAKRLAAAGVDLLDASSGGNSPLQKIPAGPGFQVPFAFEIKKQVPDLLTGAVGLITETDQAVEIVEHGKADVLLLARQFLRDPNFVLRAAHELKIPVKWPQQYDRAQFRTPRNPSTKQ